jgi:hypothetical protein
MFHQPGAGQGNSQAAHGNTPVDALMRPPIATLAQHCPRKVARLTSPQLPCLLPPLLVLVRKRHAGWMLSCSRTVDCLRPHSRLTASTGPLLGTAAWASCPSLCLLFSYAATVAFAVTQLTPIAAPPLPCHPPPRGSKPAPPQPPLRGNKLTAVGAPPQPPPLKTGWPTLTSDSFCRSPPEQSCVTTITSSLVS